MATMNISLPESMKAFVEGEVQARGYSTTSEYFRALVRDAQDGKAKEHLERLLLEGLNSGEATTMTEQDWEDIRREVRERSARRAAQRHSGA